MKKRSMFLLLTSLSMCLCSCEIFNTISSLVYSSLDEYFSKNEYSKAKSTSTFNREMQEHVYFWSEEIRTYTNTEKTNKVQYSPRGDSILYDEDYGQITVRSKFGEEIYYFTKESASLLHYQYEDNPKVYVRQNLSIEYVGSSGRPVPMDD